MNLAIVGCGDAARAVGLAARIVPGVRVRTLVDLSRERAVRLARLFPRARVETAWETVADDDGIDAAYVAVPHALHPEVALGLIRGGKAVLLEKPLAESIDSALGLIRQLPPGARLGVNYQWRFDPLVWALVEAARSGAFGEIAYIEVSVPWFRGADYFEAAPWHGLKAVAGGGTLLTQGSHALDIALLCAGSAPIAAVGASYRRVFRESEVEDLAAGVVETSLGVPITITSSMTARPGHTARLAVYGSAGSVVYSRPARSRLRSRGVPVRKPVFLTRLHPYRASLAAFREWVDHEAPYRCTASDALPVMFAVDGIYRSAAVGRRVGIDARNDPQDAD